MLHVNIVADKTKFLTIDFDLNMSILLKVRT